MECVDDGLGILGQSVRHTIYWRTTILRGVPRGGILVNPEAFVEELRALLGAGAKLIQDEIIWRIEERSGKKFDAQTLPEVIRLARREDNDTVTPIEATVPVTPTVRN